MGSPAGAVSPRDAMLNSAITLFRQRGIADTSVRDIVEHSGAPRGSIYHHFPGGKEQLAAEATERAGAFIASLLSALDERPPEEAIATFVGYWSSSMVRNEFRDGCPAAAAALSDSAPTARAAAAAAFSSWEKILTSALTARGRTPDEAASLATLAISAIEGALILSRAQQSDQPLARVGAQLRTLLADQTVV
jgi:TetR/AcrR family transcriptional repressor of lmrAB and yxaGH operons